jgi:hypothetical protein
MGRVSGYGSLFVNGIEFETDNADFYIEESLAIGGDELIDLGMVVRITGSHDGQSGVADSVEYRSELRGIVNNNALDSNGIGNLEVMGQIVQVDANTVFNDATVQDIPVTALIANDVVEVSGFSAGLGTIYATRIELISRNWTAGSEELSIKGIVAGLAGSSFRIGNLAIDFSSASLPDGVPDNGWYVEIEGDSFSPTNAFEADSVESEGEGILTVADDGDEVELEGYATSSLLNSRFHLNGQEVQVSNETRYQNGAEADIVEGREMEVEGVMNGTLLLATEIEFESSEASVQEMTGTVESITTSSGNTGSLTLFGQSISVLSTTIMEDEQGDDRDFDMTVLAQGQPVELKLITDGNELIAKKLKRLSRLEEQEITGFVQELNVGGNPDRIRVLGVVVDISGLSEFDEGVGDKAELEGDYNSAQGIFEAED